MIDTKTVAGRSVSSGQGDGENICFGNGDSPVCERVDEEGLGWRREKEGKSHVYAVAI